MIYIYIETLSKSEEKRKKTREKVKKCREKKKGAENNDENKKDKPKTAQERMVEYRANRTDN